MGAIIREKNGKQDTQGGVVDNSIYAADVKIDKTGVSWKKKTFWFRQEHLGKLKVIAHFENTTISELIDTALVEFVREKMDSSMAIKKLVKQSESGNRIVKGRN
jgi:hypothetical protein